MTNINLDIKGSNSLSGNARSNAGSFTNDSKGSNSLSGDTRSSSGSFTNDNKNNGLNFGLWSSTVFPWNLQFPWLTTSIGNILLKDIKN